MKHRILITGGGGFIGTHVSWLLSSQGHDITIIDRALPVHNFPGLYKVGDYLDFFIKNDIQYDTIIHLAAEHIVPMSVKEPKEYYTNNVTKMKEMLDLIVAQRIKNIIFSSSGNVYGRQGTEGSLVETLCYDPENPYASTKVAGELLIRDYAAAYGIKYINFRYFNAAGADPDCRFGYVQRPVTHVVPTICNKILNNTSFTIYGGDYQTTDGTCVRDYVHVDDIATAHSKALRLFDENNANHTFNLGGGSNGVSVRDLLGYAGEVIGKSPNITIGPRRQGDPTKLVANIQKAKELLHWVPQYDIRDIIRHAWNWEQKYETSK